MSAAMNEDRRPPGPTPTFETVDPRSADALWCLSQYFEELGRRFEGGFDAHSSSVADLGEFASPNGLFLVCRMEGRPVACGAVKLEGVGVGYIKRMWVDGSQRGVGLGRRMLAALEDAAGRIGCHTVQLETNRTLGEAIQLYRSSGYEEVEPFNDEYYAHHWFRKRIGVDPGGPS